MTDYVLTGLVKRRAELAGIADTLRAQLTAVTADLGHLDAVIRHFDPDYSIASIQPKRQREPDAISHGERTRAILDVLRETGEPLSAVEITRRAMIRAGQNAENQKLAWQRKRQILAALLRQEKRGVVRSVREPGRPVMWAVATE